MMTAGACVVSRAVVVEAGQPLGPAPSHHARGTMKSKMRRLFTRGWGGGAGGEGGLCGVAGKF
jgi:hypothetical protein